MLTQINQSSSGCEITKVHHPTQCFNPSRVRCNTHTVLAGLVLHQGYIPEKVMQIEQKIPISNSVFSGGLGD